MEKILSFFDQKGGYATLKELRAVPFQQKVINSLVENGKLEKIKPGLFRPSTLVTRSPIGMEVIDISKAIPEAVVCLVSALDYYDLTTFNPSRIHIAIPHGSKPTKVVYPPIETYFLPKTLYEAGIETVKTEYGEVKVYGKEKTICDMFRYRKRLGEDLAIESLKMYLNSRGASGKKLYEFTKICRVKTIIDPYIKALCSRPFLL